MKTICFAAFCCFFSAALAWAEEGVPAAPKTDVPVETVKVTDQDTGLFERIRDAHIRAEKKGLLAVNTGAAH